MLTSKTFIRNTLLKAVVEAIRQSVPERMLKMNNTEQRV